MFEEQAQIVATIGPSSASHDTFSAMVDGGLSIVRFNFAWSTNDERRSQVALVRAVAAEKGLHIPLIQDLPGPRVQTEAGHTYATPIGSSITPEDEASIRFGIEMGFEYIALSFVGNAADVHTARALVEQYGGKQKLIAKIERKVAVDVVDEILAAADALMVARGDLGNEVPIEEVPFVQAELIKKANLVGKPVIVATQMLLSMVQHPEPTRAEVTDVATAILQGADAVMLSEESATGTYPVEAVSIMRRIASTAQRHMGTSGIKHAL